MLGNSTSEDIMKSRMNLLNLAAILALGIATSAGSAWGQQVRLSARQNKVINGVEAELRGDYRENGSPSRLNAELENVNIPVGTKVAFCMLQSGVKTLIGIGKVAMVAGRPTAEIELSANDGDTVPKVIAGDVLQARQKKAAPFKANPTCGSTLLLSAAFQ
jgi:hypothetical protein